MTLHCSSKSSGIYAIVNKINGKRYVGSAQNLRRRCDNHQTKLKSDNHHCKHLQSSWKKYGYDAFEFIILEFIAIPFLLDVEQQYLDKNKLGYNTAKYAGAPTRGVKMSREMIEKMRKIHLGAKRTDETKKKMSDSQRGRVHSEYTKKKISDAKKNPSNETRKKLRAAQLGKKATVETRSKLSAIRMGHTVSITTREKLRVANSGKKPSIDIIARQNKTREKNRLLKKTSIKQMPFNF